MVSKQKNKKFSIKKIPSVGSRGRLVLFLLVFALIGGGWMAYRSFAASNNVQAFGGSTLKVYEPSDATMVNESQGSKANTPVWEMTGGAGNKFVHMKKGIVLPPSAKQVRSCAKVKLLSGTGQFVITHPNGQGFTETFNIAATKDYQEFCTQYRTLTTPINQDRSAEVGWGFGNKGTLRVGYISIGWQ